MKLYVKPSLEVSKFSVEDIITASGVMNAGTIGDNAIYNKYLMGNDEAVGGGDDLAPATNVVEFQW